MSVRASTVPISQKTPGVFNLLKLTVSGVQWRTFNASTGAEAVNSARSTREK